MKLFKNEGQQAKFKVVLGFSLMAAPVIYTMVDQLGWKFLLIVGSFLYMILAVKLIVDGGQQLDKYQLKKRGDGG